MIVFSFFDTFVWNTILLLVMSFDRLSKHLGVVVGSGRLVWSGGDFRRDFVVHSRFALCLFMVLLFLRNWSRWCNHHIVVDHSSWNNRNAVWITVGQTIGKWRYNGMRLRLGLGTLLMSILLVGLGGRMVKWVQLGILALEAVAVRHSWMMGVRLLVVHRGLLETWVTSLWVTVHASVGVTVVARVRVELVPFVRVLQALVMALVLGLEDIVFVFVGRLSARRLNLDRSIMLAIMHGLEHIWLHLEHQVSTISIGLRRAEGS